MVWGVTGTPEKRPGGLTKARQLPGRQTVVTVVTVMPGQTPAFVTHESRQVFRDVFSEGRWDA